VTACHEVLFRNETLESKVLIQRFKTACVVIIRVFMIIDMVMCFFDNLTMLSQLGVLYPWQTTGVSVSGIKCSVMLYDLFKCFQNRVMLKFTL
jgi:hypothetical protein